MMREYVRPLEVIAEYPWTRMSPALLHSLADNHPLHAVEESQHLVPQDYGFLNPGQWRTVNMAMRTVSRWVHSTRQLIKITDASGSALQEWEPRYHALPDPSERPWELGLMLELVVNITTKDTTDEGRVLIYAEPYFDGMDPGIRYAVFYNSPRLTNNQWACPAREGQDALWTYTHFDYVLDRQNGEDPHESVIKHIAVNALAAYYSAPEVIEGLRRRNKRKGKKATRSGGVRGVRRLTLTEDGARIITHRWRIEDEGGDYGDGGGGDGDGNGNLNHNPPCLHNVKPHTMRTWVKTPNVDERVLDTKTSHTQKGSHTLYMVERKRGKGIGYARGEGIRPKMSALVTGLDDY